METKWIRTRTSIAVSALVSWTTPTVAFAIRINKMTKGSTNAVAQLPPGSDTSSKQARTKDTTAEPRRMRTSWSWNCAMMSLMSGVGGSSGSSEGMPKKKIGSVSQSGWDVFHADAKPTILAVQPLILPHAYFCHSLLRRDAIMRQCILDAVCPSVGKHRIASSWLRDCLANFLCGPLKMEMTTLSRA